MAQITDLQPIGGGKITDLQPIGGMLTYPANEPTKEQLGATPPPAEQQPGAIQRYKESFRGAQGFDPQGGFVSDIKDIGSGFKQMATHPLDSGMLLLKGMSDAQQGTIDKAYGEQQSPDLWTKAKGYVRGAESAIPLVGPLLSKAGDEFSSGNIAGGMGTMTPMATFEGFKASGLASVDPKMVSDLVAKATGAGKLIERHVSIDQGRAALLNGQVKPAFQTYVGAAKNEIEQSVNSVLQADEMNSRMKGGQGSVNISSAPKAANDFVAKTGRELDGPAEKFVDQATQKPSMSMRDAKDFTSMVGEAAASLRRSGDLQNAGALDAMYNELHKATGERAGELGSQHAKLWQHYIDEHRTLKTMQEGLMGDILAENNPAKALSKLIDPKNAAELSDIKSNMRQYNLDIDQLRKGQEAAVNLDRYSQEAKASFMGKMKAIVKHPLMAGGAAIAAAKLGYMSGAPGLGLVLPILIAGKVSNLIDAAELTSLLEEIKRNNPIEAQRVLPRSTGPMEKPAPPAPGPAAPGTPPTERPPEGYFPLTPDERSALETSLGHSITPEEERLYRRTYGKEAPAPKAPDMSSDIQGTLMDEFKFSKSAAKNVTDSIAGKYSSLDEGLKMAIAEAVKRTKGSRAAESGGETWLEQERRRSPRKAMEQTAEEIKGIKERRESAAAEPKADATLKGKEAAKKSGGRE